MADSTDVRRLMTAIRCGLRGVRTSPVVFSTSVATMTAGLMVLGTYLLVWQNMRSTLRGLGDEFTVVAFLPPRVDLVDPDLTTLRGRLEAFDQVEAAVYVSRQEAMDRLRSDLGREATVLEGLDNNPLPASFELQLAAAAREPREVRRLVDRLGQIRGIDDIRYGEEWVSGYADMLEAVELTGLLLGAALVVLLSVIVGGTVRLAVYARADEIQIQRLVGAGGLYVRLPFYVQGALQGLGGAVIALILLYGLFRLDLPLLGEPLAMLTGRLPPTFFGPLEMAFVLMLGVGLGLAGAMVWLVRLEDA